MTAASSTNDGAAGQFDRLPDDADHNLMAKTTVVTVTDDIDGTTDASTVRFGLNGSLFEIDLSQKNKAKFEQGIAKFIDSGRKVGRAGAGAGRPANRAGRNDRAEIRAWAQEQGITISARGRISASVIEQYEASH